MLDGSFKFPGGLHLHANSFSCIMQHAHNAPHSWRTTSTAKRTRDVRSPSTGNTVKCASRGLSKRWTMKRRRRTLRGGRKRAGSARGYVSHVDAGIVMSWLCVQISLGMTMRLITNNECDIDFGRTALTILHDEQNTGLSPVTAANPAHGLPATTRTHGREVSRC